MRPSSSITSPLNILDDTPMIRLVYNSPTGFNREIALGVSTTATNGFDLGYDAFLADLNLEDMYWIIEENKFVIQGVNNLNINQEFPLGVQINESGIFTIHLESIENLDADLPIFIKDNVTNTTHQINSNDFELALSAGNYENRFVVTFNSQEALSVNDEIANEESILLYYNLSLESIEIFNPNNLKIEAVALYNTVGQEILNIELNTTKALNNIAVNVETGVYIVELKTDIGVITKKIIIN